MYTRTFYTDYCITYKSHVGVASSIHIKNNVIGEEFLFGAETVETI